MKKNILATIGALLILGTVVGGNLKFISNWSTPELVGFNLWTIVAIGGGAVMIYFGLRKSR